MIRKHKSPHSPSDEPRDAGSGATNSAANGSPGGIPSGATNSAASDAPGGIPSGSPNRTSSDIPSGSPTGSVNSATNETNETAKSPRNLLKSRNFLNLRKFRDSGFSYLPFKLVEGIVGMLELALYTRVFGKAVFGEYSVANASVVLLAIVSVMWLRFVGVRYIAEYQEPEKRRTFLSTIAISYLFAAILGSLVLLPLLLAGESGIRIGEEIGESVVPVGGTASVLKICAFMLYFFSYTANQLFVDLLLYDDKRRQNLILVMTAAFARPLLSLILYVSGVSPILCIVLGRGTVDLLTALITAFLFRFHGNVRFSLFHKELAKDFAKYGFPLIFLTLAMYILNISDRYIVDFFHGKEAVGIYAANYAVASSIFTLITLGLSKGFYPKLLKEWAANNTKASGNILTSAVSNYLLIGVPAAAGLAMISDDLAHLFLGVEFAEGSPVMMLTAAGMFFYGLSEYFNKGHELTKNTLNIVKNSGFAAVLNIALNFFFVSKYGFVAAAYTTLFSFIIYALSCYLLRDKEIGFSIQPRLTGNTLIATGAMCAVLAGIRSVMHAGAFRLSVLTGVGALVYAAVHLVAGTLKILNTPRTISED